MKRCAGILAAVLLACALPHAHAGKANDTLVFAAETDPGSLDPYASNGAVTRLLSRNLFDSLLYRDPTSGEYRPHLARSLRYVDPVTIEVELRPGVTFSNGERLDADDVVYTMNYVANPANKIVASNRTFFIKGAEKTGEYTARILLHKPFAAAFEYFATSVVILPDGYHRSAGPQGMGRRPIGSGPYVVTEFVPGERVVLRRRPDYFGGAQSVASIETVVYRRIAETTTQMAELLTGGVDMIWRLPPDQVKELGKRPNVQVGEAETIRFGLIMMDAMGRAGTGPLTDVRVRQAIGHAIDRDAILRRLAGGGGTKLLQVPCHPDQAGCSAAGITGFDHDPAKARRLLAEAGYPDGFEVAFWGYHERSWMEAMMSDLAKVGIRARLRYVTSGALIKAIQDGQVPFSYISWGSSGINHVSSSAGTLFTDTVYSYSGDPEVKRLFERADLSVRDDERNRLYGEALARITRMAYAVPLFPYALGYAMNRQLDARIDSDEQLRFWAMKWR